jgi:hypothetical protein
MAFLLTEVMPSSAGTVIAPPLTNGKRDQH